MEEAERIWQHAKALFSYGKVEQAFKEEKEHADQRLSTYIMAASALLMALLGIAMTWENLYLVNFASDVAAEASLNAPPLLGWEDALPYALFQLLFNVPFFMLFMYSYERIIHKIFKLTGGKGAFAEQYHLSALSMLGLAMASGLGLLTPLPCLNILAALALIVLSLYFLLIVNVKAYEMVHEITFLHGFVVVAVLMIPRFWVLMTVTDLTAGLFGLPQPGIGVG